MSHRSQRITHPDPLCGPTPEWCTAGTRQPIARDNGQGVPELPRSCPPRPPAPGEGKSPMTAPPDAWPGPADLTRPSVIQSVPAGDLAALAERIREFLVIRVCASRGHLGPNPGIRPPRSSSPTDSA